MLTTNPIATATAATSGAATDEATPTEKRTITAPAEARPALDGASRDVAAPAPDTATPDTAGEARDTDSASREGASPATHKAAPMRSRSIRWPTPRLVSKLLWAGLVIWWILEGALIVWPAMVLVGVISTLLFVPNARPTTFLRVFRDWIGVTAWIVAYGASRGAADTLGMPIQEQIWIDIDRILGFGELPTHRLQRLIDWDAPARLWEVSLSLMYVSHFVVGFAVLIVMYHRDRLVWGRWWRRIVLMGSIGLAGYVLLPSAPPWMSSESGNIAMVYEGLPRGWDAVKVDWVHRLFTFGRNHANPIAAMPSLHAAWPAMLYLFWAPRHGRFMQWVLAIYALYMGFTIVITGQHWLIDVFAGWLVAYVAHRIMLRLEAWNEQRKLDRAAEDSAAIDEPDAALVTA